MASQLQSWKNRVINPNGSVASLRASACAGNMGNVLIPERPYGQEPNLMNKAASYVRNNPTGRAIFQRKLEMGKMGNTLIPSESGTNFGPVSALSLNTTKRRKNRKSRKNRKNRRNTRRR